MKNLLFTIMAVISLASCGTIDNLDRIEGMGPIVEETLEVDDFTGIALDAPFTVNVEQGETLEFIAKGHQNIIDRLSTKVTNDKVNIKLTNGNYRDFEMEIFITVPDLKFIELDGAGKIEVGELDIEELRCHIDGAGKLNFNSDLFIENDLLIEIDGAADTYFQEVDADNITVHVDGKGDVTLRGNTNNFDISIDGLGDVEAFAMDAKKVKVNVDGLGKSEVTAEEELDVNIDGLGNVYYKGDPTIYKDIDGLGNLYNAN